MSFALDVKQVPSASGERLPKLDANRGYQYVAGVVNYTIDLDVLYIKSAEERRLWQPDMKHFYKNMNAEGEDPGKYRTCTVSSGVYSCRWNVADQITDLDRDLLEQEAAARLPSIKSEISKKAFGGDGTADTPSSPPDDDMNDANNSGSPSGEATKQEWDDGKLLLMSMRILDAGVRS